MERSGQDTLYLEVNSESGQTVKCPIQSLTAAFVTAYCKTSSVAVTLVQREGILVDVTSVPKTVFDSCCVQQLEYNSAPDTVRQCCLPAVLSADGAQVRSGLCGVLRHLVHLSEGRPIGKYHGKLLVGWLCICRNCSV